MLQFDFENCSNENAVANDDDNADLEDLDEKFDQTEQIFNFITIPSFVSLFSECTIELLSFVQITGKGVVEEDTSNPYGHFVSKSMWHFQGVCLKAVRSRNTRVKKFLTMSSRILMTPEAIYDTYVNFNDYPELYINTCNMLIRKASC